MNIQDNSAFNKLWQASYNKFGIEDLQIPTNITNLVDILQPSIDKNTDKTAVSMGAASINYSQLDRAAHQFASFLQAQQVPKGTRIAVQLPNILQYPAILLGCLHAGVILVNVNPLYTHYELAHQVEDSQAKILVIFDAMRGAYDNLADHIKSQLNMVIVCSMEKFEGLDSDLSLMMSPVESKSSELKINDNKEVRFANILSHYSANQFKTVETNLNDVALFQYTGGTTGKAKGAMLTHRNLVANVLQSYSFFGKGLENKTNGQVKVLNPLPLYHIFSFTVCGLLSIYGGWEDILITNPRDIDGLVNTIETKHPAMIPSVNTLFAGMLQHPKFATLDFSNFHFAVGGGTAIIADIARKWHEVTGKPINEGYGMSETSPVISFNPMGVESFTGTVGIPVSHTDILILDEHDNPCKIGEKGEVCVKGPQVTQGYWGKDNSNTFTKDGYFRTGDIGFINEEGNLTLVDRKKDMIIVSGFNVYPNEVEAALTEHPKVFEVGVIGIPNEKSGEAPKAYIVAADDSLTPEELAEFAKERLTGYKRPSSYKFIEELPKSAVGKILRKELRKM
ncbi:MAG: long-chain fatty acid--CoA ligase [Gammaproteobacteria bacterium]|nr:MAG: long-chain fatty acid--CoA ligase [Gammaproteobacteria bacterium]